MIAGAVDEAVKFAIANENQAPKDLALAHAAGIGASEPFDTPIGPMKPRAAMNGLIIRNGYVVAEWGDTKTVEHDLQRDQDLPVDGCRSRVAEGTDSRCHRSSARLVD